MSMREISPLRQNMIDDMTARQLGPKTQHDYIRSCKRFTAFLGRSPDTATADDIRRFQLDLERTFISGDFRDAKALRATSAHSGAASASSTAMASSQR